MDEKNDKIRKIKLGLNILVSTVLILMPLLSAILFCLKDGKSITEVFLPLGGWSDEITYYKQIEGMVEHFLPRGYFGYDQSRALCGPFGVWGFVPLIPYFLWGVVAGWGITSPIYANIFFLMIAILVYRLLARPSKVQMISLSVFWLVFYSLNRYVLSGVIEASVIAQLIIVIALSVNLYRMREEKADYAKISFRLQFVCVLVLICLMTLSRPYFAVLYLIPFFCKKSEYVKERVFTVAGAVISIALFFIMSHYFCSSYFQKMLSIPIGQEGIWSLPKSLLVTLLGGFTDIAKYIWYSIRYRDDVGWYYIVFFLETTVMAVDCLVCFFRKKPVKKLFLYMVVGNLLVLLSFIFLYDMIVAARHLLAFCVASAFLIVVQLGAQWLLPAIAVLILSLFLVGNPDPVAYRETDYAAGLKQLSDTFDEQMVLTDELSYDNVVSLVLYDKAEDGSSISVYYGKLFAVPAGFGVSLDYPELYQDSSRIKSGYVICRPDGQIRKILEENGYTCSYEDQELCLYRSAKVIEHAESR